MGAEPAGEPARLLLLHGHHLLEKGQVAIGIVAGVPGVLGAQDVGFPFRAAGDAEDLQIQRQAEGVAQRDPAHAAHKDRGDRRPLKQLHFRQAFGGVPCGHVRDLVSDHPHQFVLGVGSLEQAFVDEQVTSGQGEGVHLVRIEHLHVEGHLGIAVADQLLDQPAHVVVHLGHVQEPGALFDLGRVLGADLDLPLVGDEIGKQQVDTAVDVPGADVLHVGVGAILGHLPWRQLGFIRAGRRRCGAGRQSQDQGNCHYAHIHLLRWSSPVEMNHFAKRFTGGSPAACQSVRRRRRHVCGDRSCRLTSGSSVPCRSVSPAAGFSGRRGTRSR